MIGSRLMRSHLVSFIFQMTVIVRLYVFWQNTQYSMQETANATGKRDGVFGLNSNQFWCNLSFARHPSWDAKRTVCVSAQGYEIIHANTHINQRNGFDWCHLAIHLCHGLPSCEKDGTGNPGLLCYMIGVLVVMSTAYMGNKCNYIDII